MKSNIARCTLLVSLIGAAIAPIATAAQAPYGPRSNIYLQDIGKKEPPACGPVFAPVSSGPRMRYIVVKELDPCVEPISKPPSHWTGPRSTIPVYDIPDRLK